MFYFFCSKEKRTKTHCSVSVEKVKITGCSRCTMPSALTTVHSLGAAAAKGRKEKEKEGWFDIFWRQSPNEASGANYQLQPHLLLLRSRGLKTNRPIFFLRFFSVQELRRWGGKISFPFPSPLVTSPPPFLRPPLLLLSHVLTEL